MTYQVQVLPISGLTVVEVVAKPKSSGPTFRRFGCWITVRDLLANSLLGAIEFAFLEAELSREVPVSFKIDTSPDALYAAKFETVIASQVLSAADSMAAVPAFSMGMMTFLRPDATFEHEANWKHGLV